MGKDLTDVDLNQGLSVVIPFYNEAENTEKALKSVITAASKVSFPVEFILVNDGSSDGYPRPELTKVATVLNLNHSGRIATRLAGARHAKYPSILFIDARVWIHENSLLNLQRLLQEFPNARFWNGYVESLNKNLPQVSIWETLVRVGWSKIYSDSSTVHFGLDDFDLYPKGTGMFLASKPMWIIGLTEITAIKERSIVEISDDTFLIRNFASMSDIWIDRGFSADYSPRTKFLAFLKNAKYRGQTFVDSYWASKTIFGKLVRFLPATLLFIPVIYFSAGLKALTLTVLAALVLTEIAFFTYSLKQWRSLSRAISEAIVLLPMLINFGLGFLKAYVFRFAAGSSS
jgi:glycosyltransferase involved in cell wall biosynthesis